MKRKPESVFKKIEEEKIFEKMLAFFESMNCSNCMSSCCFIKGKKRKKKRE